LVNVAIAATSLTLLPRFLNHSNVSIAFKDFNKDEWNDLVHDFFLNHDSQTPQIWKLPFEFYKFIIENKIAKKLNKPYLNDLLLFEWIEIEVHTMPDIQIPEYKNKGNLFTDILILNQEFKLIKLEYPVHIHSPKKAKKLLGNYYLIAYRHPDSLNVNFLNLSVLHTFFIERLVEEKNTLNEIRDEASQIFNVEKDILITNISTFLNDMFLQKLILGYKILYNNI